jgi:DNA polymerase-3 subunit delta'
MNAFTQIIGHDRQKAYLQQALKHGSVHAYLFSGPSQVGKRAMVAAAVQDLTGESLEQNPNVMMVEPVNGKISVEQIRDLKERFALSSMGEQYKVAIIDDAHKMTTQAQNALLKTLEEPKGKSLLFLIAAQPEQLLETIRSRCAHVRFGLVDDVLIKASLKEKGLDDAIVTDVMSYAFGRPGCAFTLVEEEAREQYKERAQEAQAFINATLVERFAMINAWAKQKDGRKQRLQELTDHFF